MKIEISRNCKKNVQHVETSVASHCKQFERPIASQPQVNYVQRVYGALFHHLISTCIENVRFREVNDSVYCPEL